jgi:predicted phage terminase large subunit-like protein
VVNSTINKLKNIDKNKLLYILEKELYNRSLFEFFKAATRILEPSTMWSYNWHLEYVSSILQKEFERIERNEPKEKDIIINLPFRSGKSLLVSVIYPAWCLMKNPSMAILNISATQELATAFSHKALMLISSKWFQDRFPDIQLRMDSKAKGHFITTSGGSITAFGINSMIIGSGGDILIIDDPNSPNETSQTAHANVVNVYLDIIFSRLNNPSIGSRIIMQQRVNLRDLSGYLMSTNPDSYLNICIPVSLSEDLNPKELISHYKDGLFWPERFSVKVLEDFKRTLRGSAYASQLMMRPTLIEGDLIRRSWFKSIKQSEVQKYNIKWQMFVDSAYTVKTKNDPSVILIAGKYQGNLYIRKVLQRWVEFSKLIELIKEQYSIYTTQKIFIESKASGLSIQQELKRLTNFNVIPLIPTKDKIARVTAATPSCESGKIFLVEDDWNETFLTEIATFPNGRDDQVDCLTYSIQELLMKGGGTIFR